MGTEVNARCSAGRAALHVAAQALLSDLCMVILSRPDFTGVNAVGIGGKTAMHTAVGAGLDEVCLAIILTSGFSEMNVVDRDGQTVLHVAASAGLREVCLAAARKGLTDVCRAILQRRDFLAASARDNRGRAAFDYAEKHGHWDLAQILLEQESR